jgi:hypothetical protein
MLICPLPAVVFVYGCDKAVEQAGTTEVEPGAAVERRDGRPARQRLPIDRGCTAGLGTRTRLTSGVGSARR